MTEQANRQVWQWLTTAALLISAVVYVLLPIAAVSWWQQPFPGFMLDPHLVVNDTSEPEWAGSQASPPLRYPERVTAVDGQPVGSNNQFASLLAARQVGDAVEVAVTQPTDSLVTADTQRPLTRTLVLPLTTFDNADKWNHFWLLYLTGLVTLAVGVWAFRLRPDAEATQVFALLMATGSVGVGGLFDLMTTQWVTAVWVVAMPLTAIWLVWLAGIFPYETRLFTAVPRLKVLLVAVGLLVGAWGLWWLFAPPDPWAYALPWRGAYLLNGLAALTALGIMAYRSVQSPSPRVRQQGWLMLVGTALAFMPVGTFFLLASVARNPEWLVPAFYIPPIVIFPLMLGYTVIRYRLLNLKFVVRRGLVYVLLTTVLMGAFVLVINGLTMTVAPGLDFSSPLPLLIYLLLLAFIFDPLRSRLQRAVNLYFMRAQVDYDDLLRSYNRELTTAVSADQVAACLLRFARSGISDVEPSLFLPDKNTSAYVSYYNSERPFLDVESPLVDYMQQAEGVIDLAEERAWPSLFLEHRALVNTMEATVLVPMNNGESLLGWLAMPSKPAGSYYTESELSFLGSLADQSLIGLERANAMRRLESRVAELNALAQFSQMVNITIHLDDLLELVYTNFRRMLQVENLFVILRHPETGADYTAFYVEDDERLHDREGFTASVAHEAVRPVLETGQPLFTMDDNGRSWFVAPLNAGAEPLGAIYTYADNGAATLNRRRELFTVLADRTAVAIDRLQTRGQLENRARQLEIVNEITFSLASTLELEPLLNLILNKAIELLQTEAGTFMLTEPDTGDLEFKVVRGPAKDDLLGKRLPIGTGLAGTAAQTGRPVLVNRVQEDKRWFDQVDADTAFQSQSILTVPLLRQNTVLGVLQVINKRNQAPFNEEDQTLLMSFASQAVLAMENARLLEQTDKALQARVQELFMLQQLDRDLNTTLDLEHVLNLTLDWILRICQGTAGAIVLLNEQEQRPYLAATRGYDEAFDLATIAPERVETGLVGEVLRTGKPLVTGNVHEEPAYVAGAEDTHSQMTLPIVHKQTLIGAIALESDELDAFDEGEMGTAQRVIDHAAIAIANALLYQQVQAANQAKSEFVSMVSHELKTPMTSMRGYTQLLLSGMTGDLTEQQQGFLETIAANIRRMSQQIQDLTDISRIEMGKLRTEMMPMAFTNVVSETLATVKPIYEEKETELHLDLPLDLPLVLADKERMGQVLTNLLTNACKYSPPQADVHLTFRTDEVALQGDGRVCPVVICEVKDEGYGISAEDQAQLFTKFFRADNPDIRKSTGTGLGLSITKGIVELHGGKMWVESELGAGSIFAFALPQVEDKAIRP